MAEEKKYDEIKEPTFVMENGKYYFITENGKKLGKFYEAIPFREGFALVRKHSWSKWQIMNKMGALSKDSYEEVDNWGFANGYLRVFKDKQWFLRDHMGDLYGSNFAHISFVTKEGYAAVQLNAPKKGGVQVYMPEQETWKIFDIANDNLSRETFAEITDLTDGYAVVKMPAKFITVNGKTQQLEKVAGSGYRYYDFTKGLVKAVLSEEEYAVASGVRAGVSAVKQTASSDSQLRDAKTGVLSKESFVEVGEFSADEEFAFCKQYDGYYHFVDKDFNVSTDYYDKVETYKNGFAVVTPADQIQRMDTLNTYRDMLGRVTNEKTKSGEDFYKYYNGQISLKKLSALHFVDEEFCKGILKIEARKVAYKAREIYENPNLSLQEKRRQYNALTEIMAESKDIVENKKEAGKKMIENKRQEDARRREEERRRRQNIQDNKDAFDDFLKSIK